ncbi:MAG: hypothetical protein ACXWWJ_02325 [Nitrospira sp.]
MNITFSAKLVDVANLVVAKGANFLLTLLIFGLVSGGLDSGQFANFGYWWSIAIMIGGVLLGGLSSGLIRVVSVRGSLAHLRNAATRSATGFAVALAGIAGLGMLWPSQRGLLVLCAGVAAFGIVFQLQTSVLALLRAAVATRANAVASAVVVILVPAVLWATLGSRRDLPRIFLCLAVAFIAGTIAASVMTRQALGSMLTPRADLPEPDPLFLSSVGSFTAINVFSYASLNIDFTLFKWMQPPDDFAVMATGKIFFERFLLPALLVIAGAFSLSVLRYSNPASLGSGKTARAEIRVRPRYVALAGTVGVGAVLGYLWFVNSIRGDARSLPIGWVACVTTGYMIYAFNAVLLDVLVVRRGPGAVVRHVAGFLLLCLVSQAAAIRYFGMAGWAVCWFLFNIVVLTILVRDGVYPLSRDRE